MTNDTQWKTNIGQAVKRISESGTIAVVLPDHPEMEVTGSAVALVSGLKSVGKTVSVFEPHSLAPEEIITDRIHEENEPLREFIISFDLTRSPIKELKYERDQKRLNIILSPTGPRIQREDIEFRYGALRYDLVIALGVQSPEAAMTSIQAAPELLHEKPILNIDVNAANTGYGEINLVPASAENSEASLPELIHAILEALNVQSDDPERMNALFSALSAATKGFDPEHSGPGAFLLAGELMSRGAKPVALRQLPPPESSLDQDRLNARAIARSRFQKETGTLWLLITKEDFEKTNTRKEAVRRVMEKILCELPYALYYVLLWQGPEDEMVQGLIACKNNKAADKIGRSFAPIAKNMWLAAEQPFPSFAAAEKDIAQLLPDANPEYN